MDFGECLERDPTLIAGPPSRSHLMLGALLISMLAQQSLCPLLCLGCRGSVQVLALGGALLKSGTARTITVCQISLAEVSTPLLDLGGDKAPDSLCESPFAPGVGGTQDPLSSCGGTQSAYRK